MIHPGAGPFTVGDDGAPRIVLFHGLTGAPSELWPLGCALAEAGYRVEAPLWPGHGVSPEALAKHSADELLQVARRYAADPGVAVLGGLSMGALLALIATSGRETSKALLLLAPAYRLHGRSNLLIDAARVPGVSRLPFLVPKGAPETGAALSPATGFLTATEELAARVAEGAEQRPGADGRYSAIPLRWGGELLKLQRLSATAAPGVTCPVLLMHGLVDRTADPAGATALAMLLGGRVHARFLEGSPHVMTLGPERGTVAVEVVRFLTPLVKGTIR